MLSPCSFFESSQCSLLVTFTESSPDSFCTAFGHNVEYFQRNGCFFMHSRQIHSSKLVDFVSTNSKCCTGNKNYFTTMKQNYFPFWSFTKRSLQPKTKYPQHLSQTTKMKFQNYTYSFMKPVLTNNTLDHFIFYSIIWIRIRSFAGAVQSFKILIILIILIYWILPLKQCIYISQLHHICFKQYICNILQKIKIMTIHLVYICLYNMKKRTKMRKLVLLLK